MKDKKKARKYVKRILQGTAAGLGAVSISTFIVSICKGVMLPTNGKFSKIVLPIGGAMLALAIEDEYSKKLLTVIDNVDDLVTNVETIKEIYDLDTENDNIVDFN